MKTGIVTIILGMLSACGVQGPPQPRGDADGHRIPSAPVLSSPEVVSGTHESLFSTGEVVP